MFSNPSHDARRYQGKNGIIGDVLITATGNQRMKLAPKLMRQHQLTRAQALNAVKKPPIWWCAGYWADVQDEFAQLQSWGLVVRFVPHNPQPEPHWAA
nr:hypothetical protein [uncultured Kingella sp.]